MQSLYRIRFEIEPREPREPRGVAEDCLGLIDDWVGRSHRKGRTKNPGIADVEEIDLASDRPQLRRIDLASGALHYAFYWAKRDETHETTRWVTFADLISDGEGLDFQMNLGLDAISLRLDGERPTPARPRLIPTILSHPGWVCSSSGQTLSVLPLKLTAAGVEEFCTEVLFSQTRDMPIVIVTPDDLGERQPVLVDKLAERLGGTAKVYQSRDRLATRVLDQFLGRSLAIGGDAIRVFAPGLQPGSDVEGHWHFLGRTIRTKQMSTDQFADFLFSRLASRSLLRFRDSPRLQRFRHLAEKERLQKLEEVKSALAEDSEFMQQFAEEVEKQNSQLSSDKKELEEENERLRSDLQRAREELDQANRNIVELSRQLGGRPELELAEPPVSVEPLPESVLEITRAAKSASPDLMFLDSAFDSAEDVPSTYQFPERVADALAALQKGAAERRSTGRIRRGWKDFFTRLGFEYKAGISDLTKNTWGSDYTFLYEGRRELFEEHFTIGVRSANTCLSIHFSTKLRPDKIVVAYVGRHLRNTQT